jgi:hypothetical protein
LQHQKDLVIAIATILAISVILAIAAVLAISRLQRKPKLCCATISQGSSIELFLFKTTHGSRHRVLSSS